MYRLLLSLSVRGGSISLICMKIWNLAIAKKPRKRKAATKLLNHLALRIYENYGNDSLG